MDFFSFVKPKNDLETTSGKQDNVPFIPEEIKRLEQESRQSRTPERTCQYLLVSAAQSNYPQEDGEDEVTLWSIVYAPGKQWADFYFREDFKYGHRLYLRPGINNRNKFISPILHRID